MDFQLLALQIVWYSSICFNGCHGVDTTILSPQKVESAENTNVTLVCSYDGQYAGSLKQGYFAWILNPTRSETNKITTGVFNSDCIVPPGWLKNNLLYSYKCLNDTSHSVTLLNIKLQQDGETYQCRPMFGFLELPFSNIVTLRITVAVKVAAISPYTNMLTLVENGTFEFLCTSSPCQPKPKFRWYITNNNNPDGSVSILTEAAPIESEAGAIQSYTNRFGINPKRTMNDRFLFCGASNSDVDFMLSAKILINVTYPPETPAIKIMTSPGVYVQVYKTLHVIEGLPFTLNCSADSNPQVSLFQWNNLMPTDSSIFYVANADRHNAEAISCKVSNIMQTSDSSTSITGNNSTSLEVNVLYPPTVNKMPNRTVYEGDDVIHRCNYEPGNPLDTNVTWSWNGTTWNDLQLTISNVSKHQEGVYRCDVRNFMVSSDGTKTFGNASGEFYLSVQHFQSDNNDNTSPTSSNVSVFAASAGGTLAGVVFLAALITILMVYKRRKRLSYQKKEMSIQYYNCNDSKLNETISSKADNANAYESFHHTENDCQISAEGGNVHVYEGLQSKGFDQQYDTISSSACNVNIEHHKVYENLQ